MRGRGERRRRGKKRKSARKEGKWLSKPLLKPGKRRKSGMSKESLRQE
jgi:hypothetical protein